MSKINFIPCVYWVKRGVTKEIPNIIELTKEDLKRLIEESKNAITSNEENEEEMRGSSGEESDENVEEDNDENSDNIITRYNLDNYDNDDDGEVGETSLMNLANLTVFGSNDDDPYLQNDDNQDEIEENENFRIKPTDNLVLVGHVETDASVLEVQVYSEVEDHYVHHDIILPAYPICFEWLNYSANCEESVNYIAIGDMTKEISIWDIDTVNTLEPVYKLIGHEDSVLDLSWNSMLRKMLSSGSADKSCILWDLENNKVISRFTDFKDNVQSVKFHPFEAQTLLIGDSSGFVSLVDCQSGAQKKWNVCKCEIEKVIWNHYNPYQFFCSSSDGFVYNYDVRNDKKAIYSIKAHSDSVTGLALSSSCNGCLITASIDKLVKVWDVDEKHAEFITEFSDLNVGSILSLSSNPDLPFVISIGGDNNKSENFKIIDISMSKRVMSQFMPRMNKTSVKQENS